MDDDNDDALFDRVRAAIREHAVAFGPPTDRAYMVADVPGDPAHAADTANVVRIKR